MKALKTALKVLLILVLVVVIAAACLIGWLSLAEYKPDAVEELAVSAASESRTLQTGR